jgi:hypothetical protein
MQTGSQLAERMVLSRAEKGTKQKEKQMSKKWFVFGVVAMLAGSSIAAENRVGAGFSYWQFVSTPGEDGDESGLSFNASYQRRGDLLGVELGAELFPYRLDGDAWAPQAYLLVGSGIYAGLGVGIMNVDGKWADTPFIALRSGWNFEIRSNTFLDISASYRFSEKERYEEEGIDIDADTFSLGAAVQFGF